MKFLAQVKVVPQKGILEPQGKTITPHLTAAIGEHAISELMIGKYIRFVVEAKDITDAADQVIRACDKILVNPVIERYSFELMEFDA